MNIPPSPNKQRDPLGWPFGALPPNTLARLLKQKQRDDLSKAPAAPF